MLLKLYGTENKTERPVMQKIDSWRGPSMCTDLVCDFSDSLFTYLPTRKN